ncbi:hypothetical protein [Hyphomicrobium sp.]|jgi:hypothetical protein|uniref:hypothetical protein n=1 Tax=Hyphomicrobium sp. TaxID=82 RepID=UPI0035656A10
MFQRKHLIAAAVASMTVISVATPSEAHHRRGYSGYGYPNRYAYPFPYRAAYGYFYPPTYYAGPPMYPRQAFYGPLHYGPYHGRYYYRARRVYSPQW